MAIPYLPAEGAVNLPSNVRRQPRIVGLEMPDKPVSSVGKKVNRNGLQKNSEAGTNLVHLAKVQALKVLQRQVWRQNEPAIMQALLLSGVRRHGYWNSVWDLTRQGQPRTEPVLDVGFAAAEAWGVHGERDRLEPGLLGPSHKLLHHLPVLVHLQWFTAHMQKDCHAKRNYSTLQLSTHSDSFWHAYI